MIETITIILRKLSKESMDCLAKLNNILTAIKEHEKLRNDYLEVIKKNTYYIDKNITNELKELNKNIMENNRLQKERNEIANKNNGVTTK